MREERRRGNIVIFVGVLHAKTNSGNILLGYVIERYGLLVIVKITMNNL